VPRTTDAAVQGIIDHDTTIPLTPFIEAANALVTEKCTDSGYDATRLELIERWLSAHFYAIRDPRVALESVKGVMQQFSRKIGFNLQLTHYGQMAMVMDTDGNLASLSKSLEKGGKGTASIGWLGTGDSQGNDTTT
jgi:hypothetical protein